MPRRMPGLTGDLQDKIRTATAISQAGELVRAAVAPGSKASVAFRPSRLEALYELSYLRVFVSWETFLEETFLRYTCGYTSVHGMATMRAPLSYYPSLSVAFAAVGSGNDFMLWHNPTKVIARVNRFVVNGLHAQVISSQSTLLEHFAAIRHRIVHDQADARKKFDFASVQLAGRRYPASRPGRLLRDWNPNATPPQRWLETIADELLSLAGQIA